MIDLADIPVAPARCAGRQQSLPGMDDRPIETIGQLSPHIGDSIEQIAAGLLGARRLTTRAGHWCPDLELPDGAYGEVKGLGPGSSLFLHESQVAAIRDRAIDYRLVCVQHKARLRTPTTLRTAERQLLLAMTGLLVVPAERVRRSLPSSRPVTLEDGRKGRRINRRAIGAWWRSSNCNKWRMRAPRLGQACDQPLIECRGWRCSYGDHWWPLSLREAAADMLDELQAERHQVTLTPAPRPRHVGHMVRTVTKEGPAWYRELCLANPVPCRSHWRKPSTAIKRCRAIRWLERIIADQPIHPTTESMLLPHLEERADDLAR